MNFPILHMTNPGGDFNAYRKQENGKTRNESVC